MKSLLLLALVSVAAGARAQTQSGPPQVLQLPKQNGGAATFYSGNRIDAAQSPQILNGYLDADSAVVKRNGYQLYGTIPGCTSQITGSWAYTSLTGTFYAFAQCGNQMYVTNGDGNFAAIGSTITTINPTRSVGGLGEQWFTNGIDDLWYSDGVHVSSVATAPFAKLIGAYQNRIVLSDVTGGPVGAGFTAAQSGTWLSGYLDGTDYTLPAVIVDTNAAFFPLNGSNDTRQVTCSFDGFKSVEILWNNGQTWGLYGTGNSSFLLQLLSNEVGCTEQGTVREQNGGLLWLGKRGIERFDGTSMNIISWPIQDQVQNLVALQQNQQQNIQTSQADWQAGNLLASGAGAPLSATLFPGDLTVSSFSFTESASSVSAVALANIGFEAGTMANWTAGSWAVTTAGVPAQWGYGVYAAADAGACGVQTRTTPLLEILDQANSVVVSTTLSGLPYNRVLDLSAQTFTSFRIRVTGETGLQLLSDPIAPTKSLVFGYFLNSCLPSGTPGVYFDVAEPTYPSTFVGTSTVYGTSFSTPVFSAFNVSASSDSQSQLTFQVQTATSASGAWSTLAAQTPNAAFAGPSRQYVRYLPTFTNGSSTVTASYVNTNLVAEDTGYFITQCIQPVNITGWGAIQANTTPNGGSFSFWLSTGTSCAQVTNARTANWTAQTLNTTISVATSSFVAARVLVNAGTPPAIPHLLDLTLNWNTGAARPSATSAVYNKRYYLAYSTDTTAGAYNDHVLVYDTNGSWTLLDDIYASAFYVSGLKLYSGSSKSDGNVFLQDVGTVDNGSAFTFVLQTPDVDFGNFAAIKDLDDWWTEAQGTTQSGSASSVSVNYFVDGGTTAYSAGTFSTYAPERGYLFQNGSFGLNGSPTKAHTLRLQYQDQSASPLRIYQTSLRYWPESLP